jgi:DNA polymerase-3 subunit epsilon
VFRSKRAAMEALRGLSDEHRLCLRTLGFERAGKGACFRSQIGRCAGVCAGRESVHAHHARAAAALACLKTHAWPWRGPIGIVEEDTQEDPAHATVDVHVVNNWCLLGSAQSETEVAGLLDGAPRASFDLDHYKILSRHLHAGRARVVDLSGRAKVIELQAALH